MKPSGVFQVLRCDQAVDVRVDIADGEHAAVLLAQRLVAADLCVWRKVTVWRTTSAVRRPTSRMRSTSAASFVARATSMRVGDDLTHDLDVGRGFIERLEEDVGVALIEQAVESDAPGDAQIVEDGDLVGDRGSQARRHRAVEQVVIFVPAVEDDGIPGSDGFFAFDRTDDKLRRRAALFHDQGLGEVAPLSI